jgi:HD-like signal output (HDOD) protein
MRAECPGCQQVFALKSDEILTLERPVDLICPSCQSLLTFGILESRIIDAPAKDSPVPGSAAESPHEPVEPLDDTRGVAPGLKSHILRSLVNLPAMPMVILKAREIMNDPNAGLRDLAAIIENDQALVGKVLSMANSAYYGLGGQVSSIRHASVLLGLKVLGDLIVMSAAASLLNRELKGYGLDPQSAWRHSLAAALCARRIADVRQPALREDAFVVGLLHDAGKIILNPFLEKAGALVAELCPKGAPITTAVEKEALGFDHTEIIARACRFWRFPDAVVHGVRYHHRPSQSAGSLLAHIASLANRIAHLAGLGPPLNGDEALADAQTLEILQLQEEDLEGFTAATVAEVQKMESGLLEA